MDWTTSTTEYTTGYITTTAGVPASGVNIERLSVRVQRDPNKKIALVQGITETTSSVIAETQLRIQTDLTPTATTSITPCGFAYGVDGDGRMNGNFGAGTVTLFSNGVLSFRNINWKDTTSNNRCRNWTFSTIFTLV